MTEVNWAWFSQAQHCKIKVSSRSSLNAKLIVRLNKVEGPKIYVYLQPNAFDEEIEKTHGLIENNKLYN